VRAAFIVIDPPSFDETTRLGVNAVVHAHPIHATAFAVCMEMPAVHCMIAAAGGPTIRCARYANCGTAELSDSVLELLTDSNCALLGNHGIIATGPEVRDDVACCRTRNPL
jgi:L-fuculose-phosphate aldolase